MGEEKEKNITANQKFRVYVVQRNNTKYKENVVKKY